MLVISTCNPKEKNGSFQKYLNFLKSWGIEPSIFQFGNQSIFEFSLPEQWKLSRRKSFHDRINKMLSGTDAKPCGLCHSILEASTYYRCQCTSIIVVCGECCKRETLITCPLCCAKISVQLSPLGTQSNRSPIFQFDRKFKKLMPSGHKAGRDHTRLVSCGLIEEWRGD